VIAIFATRLPSGQPPVLYEDGQQTRDYVAEAERALKAGRIAQRVGA
jgi:nucleoside-diphosphate-sugar epimerase